MHIALKQAFSPPFFGGVGQVGSKGYWKDLILEAKIMKKYYYY